MSTPAHSLRLILALIFTAAAIPKILDPAAFTQSVAGYQLLPDALVRFTVLTLPWLEVLLGGRDEEALKAHAVTPAENRGLFCAVGSV